jgi:hypothetical protein
VTAPAPGTGFTYTVAGTSPVVAAQTNATGVFSGLSAGNYNVTTTNAAGCTSSPTALTVNPQPATSAAPTASVTAQPTCTIATGTITVTAPAPGTGFTYTVTGTSPVIAAQTNATGVFSGLSAGNYNVTTTNAVGCTSSPTALTVNPQPAAPAAPTASVTAQPTCTVAAGTITVTAPAPGTGFTYTVAGTSPVVAAQTNTTGVFSGLAAGNYNVTTTNVAGCTSSPTALTVNPQPSTPSAPTASVTAQPTCTVATGTITVTAPAPGKGITYTVTGTSPVKAPVTNSTGVFSGLAVGNYNVTTTNAAGCTSSPTALTVNPQSPTCNGGIFHTLVTCSDYKQGATSQLVGQLCYTTSGTKVANVTPGQFFYYTAVTAPSSSFCIDVVQTKSNTGFTFFQLQQADQIILWNANCVKVATGTEVKLGQGRICITNAVAGQLYVLSVKYDSKSVIGSSFKAPASICTFTFECKIGTKSIAGSKTSINMVPNCSTAVTTASTLVSTTTVAKTTTVDTTVSAKSSFDIVSYPNPSQSNFRFNLESISKESVTFSIFSMDGSLIEKREVSPNDVKIFEIGDRYPAGVYIVKVTQGEYMKSLRLIKK